MRLILFVCLWVLANLALATPVAQVAETKGAVSVIKAGGKRIIVSPESVLDEGDVLVTEENSTAVLAFTDGGKVALRPNTRFGIQRYRFVEALPAQDSGFFSLLAGGLRTVTGAIGKRKDREAYRMQAATATIGIRGTEYTARLCKGKDDCGSEATAQKSAPAARLAGLQGTVTATTENGSKRTLADGAALAVGDLVETGANAWVGIAFNDDTRLVLRAGSALRIKDYRFKATAPADDNFATELLKGALRAVTGRIAKRNPAQVNFSSVTATIGIRGTGFNTWCVESGSYGQGRAVAPAATTTCDQGLLTAVHEGRIAMTNRAGNVEAGVGDSAYVDGPNALPGLLTPPALLPAEDGTPAPEALPLFDTLPAPATGAGLYVLVHEGRIALTQDGETIELGAGESAFAGADGSAPHPLQVPPDFLSRDPYLRAVDFDAVSCTMQ
jgi:hypothetical protein